MNIDPARPRKWGLTNFEIGNLFFNMFFYQFVVSLKALSKHFSLVQAFMPMGGIMSRLPFSFQLL
jgi:hypothetical protein